MKNLKTITQITSFLEEILGKNAANIFSENMNEFIYFVRATALQDMHVSEKRIKGHLKKFAEGILAASIRSFLNEHYSDDTGEIDINVFDNSVYDKNMRPIDEIGKIKTFQKEMTSLMVERGMAEFHKGRELALIISARSNKNTCKNDPAININNEQSHKNTDWAVKEDLTMLELVEVEIIRLERKLPKLTSEEGKILSSLYLRLKEKTVSV